MNLVFFFFLSEFDFFCFKLFFYYYFDVNEFFKNKKYILKIIFTIFLNTIKNYA